MSFLVRTILASSLLLCVAQASAQTSDAQIYDAIASELVESIQGNTGVSGLFGFGRRSRIALWPFGRDEDLPVAREVAEAVNSSLLAALLRRPGNRYQFIGRDELRAVIADLEESGAVLEPVQEVAKRSVADILIVGRLRIEGRDVKVAYKAVTSSLPNPGVLVAATAPRSIPVTHVAGGAALDAAIVACARRLLELAPDVEELRLAGIRFEDSGIHTPFGKYVEERIANTLAGSAANALSGRRLRITQAELDERGLARLRGMEPTAKDLKVEGFEHGPGTYTLTGKYWDFGDTFEMGLRLTGLGGRTAACQQVINTASLPSGIQFRPKDTFQVLQENDRLGPIQFVLSSRRGGNPAYRVGEKAHFTMLLGADAWVYCFYRQADGSLVRIFPNSFHGDARLPGRVTHEIPSARMPFDLTVKEPTGVELLKCFALNRDVRADLPAEVADFRRLSLPPALAERLPTLFRQLRNATVTESSLVVTVTR